jgi:putative ABC transport system permease protein
LSATINGRQKLLTVAGHALSPEYIYQIAPGAVFPDYERYGVMWMARETLAAAYDLNGAFNQVALTLVRGAQAEAVIERLDELLARYGGIGAVARDDQLSHRFLTEELKQQRTVASVFPLIFFGVAAFLLNVVVSRLVGLERAQIAALKAFGYSSAAIGWHYTKLVLVVVGLGTGAGLLAGAWLGRAVSDIYMAFYSFPYMHYVLEVRVILAAVVITALFGIAGTLFSVQRAARLPPAQAMRAAPPVRYRMSLVERLGLRRWFTQPTRIILRQIERHPLRSSLGVLGVAMACGVMMIGDFQSSAIDRMISVQYGLSQREHMLVTFVEPTADSALYSLTGLPGVDHAEGYRLTPVQLTHGHRSYRTAVQGIEPGGSMLQLLDADLHPIDLPPEGIILTDWLAGILKIRPGDNLRIEVLEQQRPVVSVPVAGLSKQYMGVYGYMERRALNRLLTERGVISGALLRVDDERRADVHAALKGMPRVAGVVERQAAIRAFYEIVAQSVLFFTLIATILGASIAFGVVYNSLRIALSERSRELASLRVLGFTRAEVGQILLGRARAPDPDCHPVGFCLWLGLVCISCLSFQYRPVSNSTGSRKGNLCFCRTRRYRLLYRVERDDLAQPGTPRYGVGIKEFGVSDAENSRSPPGLAADDGCSSGVPGVGLLA